MKLLAKKFEKIINYFGVQIVIPSEHNYIATNADGSVYSYQFEPKKSQHGPTFACYSPGGNLFSGKFITKVDLEDQNWITTVVKV